VRRIQWIDIAKAFGIIAVVIGHFAPKGTTLYESLYWWTMPLFFMIGGFFVKPLYLNELPQFWRNKALPMVKQYFGFGTLLILMSFVVEQHDLQFTLAYFLRLLYGGTLLNGYLSVFWFTTVYLASLFVFSLARAYLPLIGQASLMLTSFWIGTHYTNAQAVFGQSLPGNLDLVLLAAPFMFIGWSLYQLRKYWLASPVVIGATFAVFGFMIVMQQVTNLDFYLFMKSHHITHPLLSLLIPPLIVVGLLSLAHGLEGTTFAYWLAKLGQHSLPIMYLHKAVGYTLDNFMPENFIVWVVAGILIPLLLVELVTLGRRQLLRVSYDG